MISGWLILTISAFYIGLLFTIAYMGDKRSNLYRRDATRTLVYALSLAVYCTSWTFYGAVGTAARSGMQFLPIYLGPVLVMVFFSPFLHRMILIAKRNNSTSIADFIATRYGKSTTLAVVISLLAIVGILPYIALQLKAVSMGYAVLTEGSPPGDFSNIPIHQDTALYVALSMAAFTILFGTRDIDATEHHQGMMQAIAFESVVKLVAFVAVGSYVTWWLFDGVGDVVTRLHEANLQTTFSFSAVEPWSFFTHTLLAALAIFCLPRQFHTMVVENYQPNDMRTARWALPLYLVVLTFFVIPIAAAGLLMYSSGTLDGDTFVLGIPLASGQSWLGMLAFIGGASAATGMVIVSTVTLSTMVSNEIIVPLLFRVRPLNLTGQRNFEAWLLGIRRTTIIALLVAAYGYHRIIGELFSLSSIGLMSFVAAAQFAPALVGGLLWRRGNRQGALAGIILGFVLWIYTLVVPTLVKAGTLPDYLLTYGPLGQDWLRPEALFNIALPDPLTHGALWSLGLNTLAYVLVSLMTTQRVSERIQVASFLDVAGAPGSNNLDWLSTATVEDLTALAERFIGPERTHKALETFERRHRVRLAPGKAASAELVKYIERQLASVIGSSTARAVLNSAIRNQGMGLEELVSIVDEASQVIQFNRELLQAAIENMTQGVSVVDKDLRLVAWNSRYVEMFRYPKGFVRVGRPVEELIRYNLLMAHVPARKAQKIVDNQLRHMRDGQPVEYERTRPDGTVIHIQGSPMPGGGFVTTFSDITAMRKAEEALRETNLYLEQRVRERTEELSALNAQLVRAKSAAEQANQGKTRFLAAASHDLLQPLNAARLFTSALQQQIQPAQPQLKELVDHIDHSLQSAEEILSTLLDISKLDAGALEPHFSTFCLRDLLTNLAAEFQVIAADKGLTLHTVPSGIWVHSDSKLLRRLIQNLLSNAVRYTEKGRILIGCRRRGQQVEIQVWDTGPGIPEDQLHSIFEEFRRLNTGKEKTGLGLGLAIVDRVSKLLGTPVQVCSVLGKGSMFSVTVPVAQPDTLTRTEQASPMVSRSPRRSLEGICVLCIDNEPHILEGMAAVLGGWGCEVLKATGIEDVLRQYKDSPPDLMIVDYQLDDGEDGLDTMDELRVLWGEEIPGLLVTALNTDEVREEAARRGYPILHKPVKPAPLRAMLNRLLAQRRKTTRNGDPA